MEETNKYINVLQIIMGYRSEKKDKKETGQKERTMGMQKRAKKEEIYIYICIHKTVKITMLLFLLVY